MFALFYHSSQNQQHGVEAWNEELIRKLFFSEIIFGLLNLFPWVLSSLLCVQVHKSKANADSENLSDVETQAYAKFFADAFAQRFPEAPIQFVETWLVELPAGAMTRYATLERFIEGTYQKYTSNCGYVADGAALAEAFSHFSYCHSGPWLVKKFVQYDTCCVLAFPSF